MSLLAVLTIKVSAILLLALIGTLCLRKSSAAARRWVLAVGVVSAVAAPALHFLPIPPVRVAPVEPLVSDALRLGPDVPFTEPAVATVASDDVVGRLAVTIWLVGAAASAGVLLVRVGEAPMAPRVVEPGEGWAVASTVCRPRGVVRPGTRRRPAPGSASGSGGDVGLAPAGRHVAGVGVRVVDGADARRAAARARARAPRRLGAANVGRSVALCLVVQPAGVGGPCPAPPRERARGRRPRAGSGRSCRHLRGASRRARERGSETPADVVAGAGDGASVTS